MSMTSVFAPIFKSEELDDGTIVVYGKATDDALDRDQQRCDPEWLNEAMPTWYRTGANIRSQHDPKSAVGVGIGHDIAADGHYVKSHIIDPLAVAKVKAGVFKGYSIGVANPKISLKSADAPKGLIHGGEIVELSLCDRPANPGCLINLVKSAQPGMDIDAADFDEERGLVRCEELVEKAAEPETKRPSPLDMPGAKRPGGDTVEKATDVAHLDAPNHSQTCENCGEEGHLECHELAAKPDAEKATDYAAEAHAAAMSGGSGCGCCLDCICTNGDLDTPAGKAADFDREAVKALVERLSKAKMPDNYDEEQGDIANAQAAISIISQLIVSEAQEMVDNPAEDCDIQLLLSAVSSLRYFISREQEQAMGDNETAMALFSADVDKAANKEPYGAVEYADPGYQKDGKKRYPIDTEKHVRAALSYINQEDNADEYSSDQLKKVKGRIMAAAKKLGIEVSSDKAADADLPTDDTGDVAKSTLAAAEAAVDQVLNKMKDADEAPEATEDEVEKTAEPAVEKADVVEEDDTQSALVKAFTAALEKADGPLNKMFKAIEAKAEDTVKSVSDLTERMSKVEAMAVPGGPAVRRTADERKDARKADLLMEAARFKALAQHSDDPDLRRGYTAKAATLEAEIKALV